ncbi:hypothetical protein ACOTDT_17040 [Achromobacter xylosoxidans]|nr:hypothetical protein [Achromobacter xylosoxidans]
MDAFFSAVGIAVVGFLAGYGAFNLAVWLIGRWLGSPGDFDA